MSENVLLTLIWVSAILVASVVLALFASASGKSNFEALLDAWREKRLAEIELKKIQAQHERVCPRFTDKPRGT